MGNDCPRSGSDPQRRTWWAGLGLLVAVGTVLRLWHIDAQSLWLDETLFLHAALLPTVRDLITFLAEHDYHPPAYLLLLRFWLKTFGSSDFAVRALPALFGVLLIPATAAFCHTLVRRRSAAVAAAFIVTFNGYQLYLSQEGRHYSWLALIAVVHMLAFVKLLGADGRRWLPLFALSGIIGLFSHYYMLLVLGAEALLAMTAPRRRLLLTVLGVCVAVFLVTWAKTLVLQNQRRSLWGEGFMDPDSNALGVVLVVVRNLGWTVLDFSTGSYIRLFGEKGFDLPDLLKIAVGLSVAAVAVFGVVHVARIAHSPSLLRILGALGLLPITGAIAGGLLQANVYETKYVAFVAPLWATVLGAGCAALMKGWVGRAIVAVVAGGLWISAWHFHTEAMPWKEDWRGAAHILQQGWRPGDVMLQRAHYTSLSLDRYLPFQPVRLESGKARFPSPAIADSVTAEVRRRDAVRLWVVLSHDERALYTVRLLEKVLPLEEQWALQGILIARFGGLTG
ncbi:glycosyltransferase family 39 protein [Candidatus Fermentibacteria bacterium]|nr:glycosyltransferase family 39 protein [Candidatus Fermentibacteria bacterium]